MFTGQNQLPSNAPVTVVCIDRILNGLPVGTFYNAYQPGPAAFWGLGELVLKMDALFDLIGFPNPAFQLRSFQRKDVPAPPGSACGFRPPGRIGNRRRLRLFRGAGNLCDPSAVPAERELAGLCGMAGRKKRRNLSAVRWS